MRTQRGARPLSQPQAVAPADSSYGASCSHGRARTLASTMGMSQAPLMVRAASPIAQCCYRAIHPPPLLLLLPVPRAVQAQHRLQL